MDGCTPACMYMCVSLSSYFLWHPVSRDTEKNLDLVGHVKKVTDPTKPHAALIPCCNFIIPSSSTLSSGASTGHAHVLPSAVVHV